MGGDVTKREGADAIWGRDFGMGTLDEGGNIVLRRGLCSRRGRHAGHGRRGANSDRNDVGVYKCNVFHHGHIRGHIIGVVV